MQLQPKKIFNGLMENDYGNPKRKVKTTIKFE